MLAIEPQEAASLAKAIQNVQKHYPMKASAEALAWVNLVMVMGTVYGTRILAWKVMQKAETPAPQPASNVTRFSTPGLGTL